MLFESEKNKNIHELKVEKRRLEHKLRKINRKKWKGRMSRKKEKYPIRTHGKKTAQRKNKSRVLKIGTWNVHSMKKTERWSHILAQEMKEAGCDIIGLQEVRYKGTGELEERDSGFTIYYSGNNKGQNYGVGIAIRTALVKTAIIEVKPINDRLLHAYIKFPLQQRATHFIVVYRRTECDINEEEKDEMDTKIENIIRGIPHNDALYVIGDFNARTGSERDGIEKILGPHGMNEKSRNGERLINLCIREKLTITNTWFAKRKSQATFWDLRSKEGRRIDYILTRQRDRPKIINCDTYTMSNLSDHSMPTITTSTRYCRGNRVNKKQQKKKRINRRALKESDNKELLEESIESKIRTFQETNGDEYIISAAELEQIIYSSSLEILGEEVRPKRTDWLSEHTEVIESFRRKNKIAWQKVKQCPESQKQKKVELRKLAKTASKQLKTLMKNLAAQHMRRDVEQKLDLLKDRTDYDSLSDFFKRINELPLDITPLKGVQPIKNSSGKMVYTESEIISAWADHFEKLFAGEGRTISADENATDRLLQYGIDKALGDPPTLGELSNTIHLLKNRKATGEDMIPIEILKSFSENGRTMDALLALICECWEKGVVPQEWKDAEITILFKKGDKTNCNNYRGISLMSHVGKIVAKIIAIRLYDYFEAIGVIPEEQSGFRENRACRDMIFALRRIQEEANEKNSPLYALFVDLMKAYDSVDRRTLWKILKKFGVDNRLIRMIRAFHDGMKARVNISGKYSKWLSIEQGLRQGCVMATILFNIFFAVILHEAKKQMGDVGIAIKTNFDENLTKDFRKIVENGTTIWKLWSMLFADDAAFISSSEAELQSVATILDETCTKFGLTISVPKTKVVVQKTKREAVKNTTKLVIGNNLLEEVEKFKYLGVIVTSDGSLTKELNHRISLAWVRFTDRINTIFQRYGLPLHYKIWMYKTYVLTTLLYGCESWTPSTDEFRRLETAQRKMLMIILGIRHRDHVSYVEILQRTNMICIEARVRKQRLLWCGNMIRMGNHRIPTKLLLGTFVDGKRSQGKPKQTLRDALHKDLSLYFPEEKNMIQSWMEIAEDAITWAETVEEGKNYFIRRWEKVRAEKKAKELFKELPFHP
jgi:exonuclease III